MKEKRTICFTPEQPMDAYPIMKEIVSKYRRQLKADPRTVDRSPVEKLAYQEIFSQFFEQTHVLVYRK